MRAVEELSKVANDTALNAAAAAALTYGQASMQSLLWNSTHGYYRAYTGGDAIMVRALPPLLSLVLPGPLLLAAAAAAGRLPVRPDGRPRARPRLGAAPGPDRLAPCRRGGAQ